jgi:hypothetical protein
MSSNDTATEEELAELKKWGDDITNDVVSDEDSMDGGNVVGGSSIPDQSLAHLVDNEGFSEMGSSLNNIDEGATISRKVWEEEEHQQNTENLLERKAGRGGGVSARMDPWRMSPGEEGMHGKVGWINKSPSPGLKEGIERADRGMEHLDQQRSDSQTGSGAAGTPLRDQKKCILSLVSSSTLEDDTTHHLSRCLTPTPNGPDQSLNVGSAFSSVKSADRQGTRQEPENWLERMKQ